MISFLIRRIFHLVPVLWGVGSCVFLLLHLIPGDPIDIMLGESALPASKQELRSQLKLDLPLPEQYWEFWKGVLVFDFGESIISRKPVKELMGERIPNTLSLTLFTLAWTIPLAIALGSISAAWKNSVVDHFILATTILGVSMPSFWFGPLLMLLFSVSLGVLPVSEMTDWRSYILPSLTLGIGFASVLTRMIRASLEDTLGQDYILTAESKGLSRPTVILKHALKNALIPVITLIGLQMGSLLAGAVITETIFDWPGMGELVVRGIQSRDFPVVQGCVLVIAVAYVASNSLADWLYTLANPRVEIS